MEELSESQIKRITRISRIKPFGLGKPPGKMKRERAAVDGDELSESRIELGQSVAFDVSEVQ